MKKKQPSGAMNRRKAKARALVADRLMPRAPHSKEFASLTGIAKIQARNYVAWAEQRISTDEYLVASKGLTDLARTQSAITAERQLAVDEALLTAVEKHEASQDGAHLVHVDSVPTEAPVIGEYLPRESADDSDFSQETE